MKFLALVLLIPMLSFGQSYDFEASQDHPFGRPNPDAPEQIKDFEPMIGECTCLSQNRNSAGEWKPPITMKWRFKYIMNGTAVQDETLKEDGVHSGSIRQFNSDSLKWNVHYYSSNMSPTLPNWWGERKGDEIVLYRDQKSPNGLDGYSRLTFFDFSEKGYQWIGEWVDEGESFSYAFWRIACFRNSEDLEGFEFKD